jgi:hypothetical protein
MIYQRLGEFVFRGNVAAREILSGRGSTSDDRQKLHERYEYSVHKRIDIGAGPATEPVEQRPRFQFVDHRKCFFARERRVGGQQSHRGVLELNQDGEAIYDRDLENIAASTQRLRLLPRSCSADR